MLGVVVRTVVVVAVGGAVRAFAGFATFGHAHIRGLGTPRPLFVARPLSKVERARPGGQVLRRRNAELCARAGKCSGRLASRNGLSVSVSSSVSCEWLVWVSVRAR